MSNARPGICHTADEHREILLKLDADEIQRLYQEKFAEMIKASNNSSNSTTPDPSRKRSYISSPTMSEPVMREKPSPMNRSLTAPQFNDLDAQSIKSGFATLPSTPGSSRPGSTTGGQSARLKKASLPASKFSFTTLKDEAMSIAAEQLGDNVNVSSVSVVQANEDQQLPAKKKLSLRGLSLGVMGANKRKVSEPPMEIRFTFNPSVTSPGPATGSSASGLSPRENTIDEATEDCQGNEATLPSFAVTITDTDEELNELEGMEFGGDKAHPEVMQKLDKPEHKLSTAESELSHTTLTNGTEDSTTLVLDEHPGETSTDDPMPLQVFHQRKPSNIQAHSPIERKISHLMIPPLENGYSTSSLDTRSLASMRSMTSLRSKMSVMSSNHPQDQIKTEDERNAERRERFWDSFVTVFSFMYGIGLVMIAIIIYTFDHFGKRSKKTLSQAGDAFNIVLCIFGISVISFLLFDINKYLSMMRKYYDEEPQGRGGIKLIETEDGELIISMPLVTSEPKKIPQYYCFTTGRHSGSFFLKIGAAIFCLFHIIHMFTLIVKQALFFDFDATERERLKNANLTYNDYFDCGTPSNLIYSVLQAIYVMLQLFMIFKYSNVIVNRSKRVARIAFIHCMASSICFWIYTIFNETVDYIIEKNLLKSNQSLEHPVEVCIARNETNVTATFELEMDCYNAIVGRCIKLSNDFVTEQLNSSSQSSPVEIIFNDLIPYWYPFSIEFNIMVAGIWYIMWDNIGKVAEHSRSMEFLPSPRGSIDSGSTKAVHESLIVVADCSASVKGIFLGLLQCIVCIGGIILYEVLPDGQKANDVVECLMLTSMIVASIWVYINIYDLDVNPNPISFLDDLLLFVCFPSFLLYGILSGIAGIGEGDNGTLITNILMVLQVIIQTPMIVDGLRRCSDSRHNQTRKPGRNMLTFLIIANLAMYIWETMENKTSSLAKNRKEYYGDEFWIIASHTTLPLCIFYRFHSAVALADIWSSAYKPGSHH